MREIEIHSWDELQTAVFDNVWDARIQRYRANRVYRGSGDREYTLTPKLNRELKHDLSLEQSVMRSFRKYGYADLIGYDSFWQIMAVAQHYGLPTRLLDFTYSPLVAAHFATEDTALYDRDGAIDCVEIERVNMRLPAALREVLDANRCNIFTLEMLDRIADGLPALEAISDTPFALFYEPASMIDRISNQYALFSLVSDARVTLAELLTEPEDSVKIIIPAKRKLEIRDKLDYINISERMIYPGLDGICKWISRQYAALGPIYNDHTRESRQ